LIASLSLVFSRPAVMDIDGQQVLSDVSPVTAGGVAYLPIRAVSDAAGAVTTYDAATGALTLRRGTQTLTMSVGQRHATLDGRPIELAHAPFAVHGRVMVRGIDVAMMLGSNVKYDARHGRIDVRTPGAVVAGVPDSSP
jgi:hypothetical protein